jgi:hypothetical protein
MGQEISLFLLDFSDSVPKENSNNGESEGNKRRKCLVCGSVGKKWLSSWKANQAGRRHI